MLSSFSYVDALDALSRDAHTSPCWQTAVGALVRGCRDIEADDIARSRFAVQLTNWRVNFHIYTTHCFSVYLFLILSSHCISHCTNSKTNIKIVTLPRVDLGHITAHLP